MRVTSVGAALALAAALLHGLPAESAAAGRPAGAAEERVEADGADEVHYSYGEADSEVVFDWRGPAAEIRWGRDSAYDRKAAASPSAITPVDIAGPFREVRLTGLSPDTTYHYSIGGGDDRTFRSRPTGGFRWVDVGDTGTTDCAPWLEGTHDLIAAQDPHVVTHGGDISYANECGVQAVHRYYTDQETWSHGAAFQPVWGNHEYGPPSGAPDGTPRDSLANYKGRSYVTNAQTAPSDTASKVKHPGCGEPGKANTCRGEDWGWFQAGRVLFISHPEPWPGAYADWRAGADKLMERAQADSKIDFIVTYGHRPAYSSVPVQLSEELRAELGVLARKYSPHDGGKGKYVLNVGHHVHGGEVFAPVDGLVHVTNGGGGVEQIKYPSAHAEGSVFRTVHPEILSAVYDDGAHRLTVSLICGPEYTPSPKESCTPGAPLHTLTFQR